MATDLRFGEVSSHPRPEHRKYAGRLVIPSFSARGTVTDLAFRCLAGHVCEDTVLWVDDEGKDHHCPRYLFVPGIEKRLYHVESVATNEPWIHITEGQLDAATLVACGLPAVAVPGAKAWKPHAHRLFQGFERVLFWADQDDKGSSMQLFEKIRQGVSTVEVMMVPPGQDVNSFYVQSGREGILSLLEQKDEDADARDDIAADGGLPDPVHYDEHGEPIPF